MKTNDPDETVLKARFAALRGVESASAPEFTRLLLRARNEGALPVPRGPSWRTLLLLAPAAAAAVVVLFLNPLQEGPPASSSLAESLPILLPHDPGPADFTAGAALTLPSDPLLPFHLRIQF